MSSNHDSYKLKTAIDFVKHGVLSRQFEESLTELHFTSRGVQSYNGVVCIHYPFAFPDMTFSVSSIKLIKAIEACNFAPMMRLSEKNIIIKGNNFRSILEQNPSPSPIKKAKGEIYKLPSNFIEKLALIYPLISDDASRQWSQTVLIKKGYLYVTNNVVAARVKINLPNCILPIELISVLLKLKKHHPTSIILANKAERIHYKGGAWVQCSRSTVTWPKTINTFFAKKPKKIPTIPLGFKDAVNTIAPFMDDDDVLSIEKGVMSSGNTKIKGMKVPDCHVSCQNLKRVLEIFTKIDFKDKILRLSGGGIEGVMAQTVKQ